MNTGIFKSYDVRGIYPEEVNEEIVKRVASALAKTFKEGEIVVGYDARLSSLSLYKAVIESLGNRKIIEAGMITKPMFYFLVGTLGAELGIMVTASHNPKEYNGLKMVKKNAVPISGKEVLELINSKS